MDVPEPQTVAPPRTIRHAVVSIDDLLPEATLATLFAGVLALERDFVPAGTHGERTDARRSLVLDPPPALVRPVVDLVRAAMPEVLAAIRLPQVEVAETEVQVTANNDGAFFAIHTDQDYGKVNRRHLTYVYYFNAQPKAFTGGELRVYDDILRNNKLARGDTFQVVEPRHNSIVFFWARVMHEVMPVHVPSRLFRDSRFTVNGWVNRAPG